MIIKSTEFDLEHDGLDPALCIVWSLTYSFNGGKPKVVTNPNGLTLRDIPKEFIKAVTDPNVLVIVHNVKNDCAILLAQFNILCNNLWCTQESERCVTGVAIPVELSRKKTLTKQEQAFLDAYSVALDKVLIRYGFVKSMDKLTRENFIGRPKGLPFTKIELSYMVTDVKYLLKLQRAQEYLLRRDNQYELALLENRYAYKKVISKVRGIGLDKTIWRDLATKYGREFRRRLALLPKEVDNWNSPQQVKNYFKYNHNLEIKTFKSKTPDVADLASLYLETKNKTLGRFILARELHKWVTSYGLGWLKESDVPKQNKDYIGVDGRLHPSIRQQIETGRIAMNNPNLLQLPGFGRRDYEYEKVMDTLYAEIGMKRLKPEHRKAFVPTPGNVFVIGDFGGQEIGVAAAASGERLWLDALLRGDDVHSMTAGASNPEEWKAGYAKDCKFPKKCKCPRHTPVRERAKMSNFRKLYGGGVNSFAKATGMSLRDAKIFLARHDRALRTLNKFLDKCAREALDKGVAYSASPYRRRRVLKADESWRIENQGKNHPIQGAGADMIKLAVISIPDKYYQPLDIYDEIILEVPKKEGPIAAKVLKSVMEQAADYITGVKGIIKVEPKIQINLAKDDETAIVKYKQTA